MARRERRQRRRSVRLSLTEPEMENQESEETSDPLENQNQPPQRSAVTNDNWIDDYNKNQTAWQARADEYVRRIREGKVRCRATLRELRYAYVVQGMSPREIEQEYRIPKRYVWALATVYRWSKTKREIDDKIIEAAAKNLQPKLESITALGAHALVEFLTNFIKSGDARRMSPKDAKMLSDVTANVHRVTQLVKGEPTDIVKSIRQMGPEELFKAAVHLFRDLKDDPLIEQDMLEHDDPKLLTAPPGEIEMTDITLQPEVVGNDAAGK
jgi:hypothetical protein